MILVGGWKQAAKGEETGKQAFFVKAAMTRGGRVRAHNH